MNNKLIPLIASLLPIAALSADVVTTKDGSRLVGSITKIDNGVIFLNTKYAGEIEIAQTDVQSLNSDEVVSARLSNNDTATGKLSIDDSGNLKVGQTSTKIGNLVDLWPNNGEDPEVVRQRMETEAQRKIWSFDGMLEITGEEGNNTEFDIGIDLDLRRKGPKDDIHLYTYYDLGEQNGTETDDELIIGGSYDYYITESNGWYIRQEFEMDEPNAIDFQSTSGFGYSHRFINKPHQTLRGRAGIGYISKSFTTDAPDDEYMTADFNLLHTYKFNDGLSMTNELSYVPSLEDFADYEIDLDNHFELSLAEMQSWAFRMGVLFEYDSATAAEEKLDTTYYTKIIYTWKQK